MSFDRLSSLEAGAGGYSDDPGFKQLQTELMNKVLGLRRNISKLSSDVDLLGTRRDTPRVRERVHNLLEQSRDTCKDIGEGVKKLQTWKDLTVRFFLFYFFLLTNRKSGLATNCLLTWTVTSRNNKSTTRRAFRQISKTLSKNSS